LPSNKPLSTNAYLSNYIDLSTSLEPHCFKRNLTLGHVKKYVYIIRTLVPLDLTLSFVND
jgi:hypothetical protein